MCCRNHCGALGEKETQSQPPTDSSNWECHHDAHRLRRDPSVSLCWSSVCQPTNRVSFKLPTCWWECFCCRWWHTNQTFCLHKVTKHFCCHHLTCPASNNWSNHSEKMHQSLQLPKALDKNDIVLLLSNLPIQPVMMPLTIISLLLAAVCSHSRKENVRRHFEAKKIKKIGGKKCLGKVSDSVVKWRVKLPHIWGGQQVGFGLYWSRTWRQIC